MSVPRLVSSVTVLRALLALCVAAYALFLSNLGCSSGAVCYRQTDCPSGTSCQSGQCVRPTPGDAGVAGTAGSDGTPSAGAGDIGGGP